MMLQVVLWAGVVVFGFLWWKRHSANKRARTRN